MTETDSMVERVARAIYEADPAEGQETDIDDRPLGEPYHIKWEDIQAFDSPAVEMYRKMARAAIEAMKEPTPGMVDAIHDGDFDIYWSYRADGTPGSPDDVWSAMIVKALEE